MFRKQIYYSANQQIYYSDVDWLESDDDLVGSDNERELELLCHP